MNEAVAHAPERSTHPHVGSSEAGRLAALDSYDVLDTLAEPAFDRIVSLAALLLDVPIALISLIDAERQWFKARYGLDSPETPRATAFCDHAIRGRELFVVPDAEQDERFIANPLVTGAPYIRFYAGAPLVTPDGFTLGTLCTLDRAPRHLSPREAAILATLAEQVVHELEMRAALGKMYQEVSEGRRTSRTLQGEGAKLAALLNATGTAVITADSCGQVASLNRVAESLFGLSSNEALGWPIQSLIATASGRLNGDASETTTESTGRRKDGSEFPIEIAHADWVDAEGRKASGAILRDVTKRHEAELHRLERDAAERRQEKLAVLGQMAGGIAHEINNLLQPVIGLAAIELESMQPDGSAERIASRENLELVLDCGRQMRGIVRKILVFARKDGPGLVAVEFAATLRTTLAFVGNLLPAGICVRTDLDGGPDGLPLQNRALINEVELIEVMSNLALNAAHAMKGRGVLSVQLRRAVLAETAAALLGIRPGVYFRVSVTDEGTGMDAATLEQIFHPFFTTKDVGEGTGLGLSMVHGVLRDWKGAIEVESVLGHGTVFTLSIPILEQV